MANMVAFFGDTTNELRIRHSRAGKNPLSRTVTAFDQECCKRHLYDIVYMANMHRYRINPGLRRALAATCNQHVTEVSLNVLVRGIGYRDEHVLAGEPSRCRGRNLLGRILMAIHQDNGSDPSSSPRPGSHPTASPAPPEPSFTPINSVRSLPSRDGIHETSDPSHAALRPNFPLGLLLPPFIPDSSPVSQLASVSAVSAAASTVRTASHRPIPGHGPCRIDGFLTFNDSSLVDPTPPSDVGSWTFLTRVRANR